MKTARIEIAPELLVDWLCLSREHRIIGVQWEPRLLVLRVEGPDLPEVPDGAAPLLITPVYRRKKHELVSLGTEEKP